MKISKSDIIFEHQTVSNYIPNYEKAYFGGIHGKEGIKNQMSSYIDGYREAVNAIFDRFNLEAKQGHIWVQDTIVFSLIYTHRHCVELELKRLFCLTDKKFEELAQNNTHRLCELWTRVKDFLITRANRLDIKIDIDALNHYIIAVDSYDEGSFRFRYPMDTKLNSTNISLELINIATFHRQMNLFHDTMESIYHTLDNQVDEWALNKDFKRNFLYCLRIGFETLKSTLSYEYPELTIPNKPWLSPSEIPQLSDEEQEREYKYCQSVPHDIKEIILILFYTLDKLKINNIATSNKIERLSDLLKVCNDTFSNRNIFTENNLDKVFWEKFYQIVHNKDKIISLTNEILSLSQ